MVCHAVEPALSFTARIDDGTRLVRGSIIATVAGSLRGILAAERTALNFLQRLSGIATVTRKFVDAASSFPARILDTRKTTPGWRLLEKYAVRMGGGTNHRVGLFDAILIKDNHLAGLNGDVRRAVEMARTYPGNTGLPVEVEVETLEQLDEALAVRAEIVLLDNMNLDQLRAAVVRRDARAPGVQLEASGGVNLATVRDIASTGVDRISVGRAHSLRTLSRHRARLPSMSPRIALISRPWTVPAKPGSSKPLASAGRTLVYDSLESTNSSAARLAATRVDADGLALIAEHQSAGRGQYGRVWHSPAGSSLLLSVILRPPRELCRPVVLTALAAVAVAEAVYALTGTQAQLEVAERSPRKGEKSLRSPDRATCHGNRYGDWPQSEAERGGVYNCRITGCDIACHAVASTTDAPRGGRGCPPLSRPGVRAIDRRGAHGA